MGSEPGFSLFVLTRFLYANRRPPRIKSGGRLSLEIALYHHAEALRRTRDAGIEPSGAAVLEGEAFVEQHHVVPLRSLRLVHGEHVAVVELVIGLALLPGERVE